MLSLKLLSFSDSDMQTNIEHIYEGIQGLSFQIPEQVFQAFDTLTRFVGYIMPLRLYTPIIVLILGYWLLLITSASMKFTFNIVKRLVSFFV